MKNKSECCELLSCCGDLFLEDFVSRQFLINMGEKQKNDCEFQKHTRNLKNCKNEKNYKKLVKYLEDFDYKYIFKPILDRFTKKCYCKVLKMLRKNYHHLYVDDDDKIVWNSTKKSINTFCNYNNGHINDDNIDVKDYKNDYAKHTNEKLIVVTITGSTLIQYIPFYPAHIQQIQERVQPRVQQRVQMVQPMVQPMVQQRVQQIRFMVQQSVQQIANIPIPIPY